MSARGIRPIATLAGDIADKLLSRAVRQLEERVAEMIGHTHDVATAAAPGFLPALAGYALPRVIVKTADTPFASVTAANVPRDASGTPLMAFDVLAGRHYHFRWVSAVRSGTAGLAIAMSVTHPGATVFAASGRFAGHATDGTDCEWVGNITASDDAVVPSGLAATATDYIFTIEGILVPSSNGRLILRARTETGTNPITVRRGSLGILWEPVNR